MADDKIILKAEDLDGYLTEQDQADLKNLASMYQDAMKAFVPLDKQKTIECFDKMGHEMQNILKKHPSIKVFSFETEEGSHA